MRQALLSVLLVTMTGACSPAGRTAAGATVAGAGALVTAAAVAGMAGLCATDEQGRPCQNDRPTSPNVGIPVAAGGLGMVVLGGMILAGGKGSGNSDLPRPESFTEPAPPEKPTPLTETDALGMAVAWLMLAGIDGRQIKLLGVDSKQSHLEVEGAQAELWNLRVHTAADQDWLRVGACYEFDGEWKVTSLGAGPCAR